MSTQTKKTNKLKKAKKPMYIESTIKPYKSVTVKSLQPAMSGTKQHGREQIATVAGSTGFACTRYQINPGLDQFPWLSLAAKGWDKYRFTRFEAFYAPSAASAATVGQTQLAFEYDPTDNAPSTEKAMSAYEGSSPCAVRDVNRIKATCDNVVRRIRAGILPGDLGIYDPFSIMLATNACAAATAIGTLWVDYDIIFSKKQVEPATVVARAHSVYAPTSGRTLPTGVPAALYWQTLSDGLQFGTCTSGSFYPPYGAYMLIGAIGCTDSANENCLVELELKKNSASLTPVQSSTSETLMIANGNIMLPFHFYFTANGTDIITTTCTVTGAAGTLNVVQVDTMMFVFAA